MSRLSLLLIGLLAADGAVARNRALTSQHAPVVRDGAAYAPGCPDWSDAYANSGEATATNFGCAAAANLAAMVVDPADLLRGRADANQPGETAARAVRAWRGTEPSSKQWQVKIADGVGK